MSRSDLKLDSDDDTIDQSINQPINDGPTPRSLLKGLSSRASSMADSLSKGVLIAQQWTKEKLGTAQPINQSTDLQQQILLINEIANQSKAIEKALNQSIQCEHAALLQHEQLAQLIQKVAVTHQSTNQSINQPNNQSNVEDNASINPSMDKLLSAFAGAFPADVVARTRDSSINLSQFQPYMRRVLAVRMLVADQKAVFLGHLQSLNQVTVKPALSAINQLEIDRLHHDACQSKVNQMISINYTFNSTADEAEYYNSLKNAREKSDTAHAKLERSKVMVYEHAAHLQQRFQSTIDQGINQYMIVELEHWMQSLQLLSRMKRGETIAVKPDATSPAFKPVAVPVHQSINESIDEYDRPLEAEVDEHVSISKSPDAPADL